MEANKFKIILERYVVNLLRMGEIGILNIESLGDFSIEYDPRVPRDVFNVGVKFLVDKVDRDLIRTWFDNVIRIDTTYDYFLRILYEVVRTGVLMISLGIRTEILSTMIDSEIPLEFKIDH